MLAKFERLTPVSGAGGEKGRHVYLRLIQKEINAERSHELSKNDDPLINTRYSGGCGLR